MPVNRAIHQDCCKRCHEPLPPYAVSDVMSLDTYSVTFGSGIRGELNEIYQRAKQNGAIVETLEPETTPKPIGNKLSAVGFSQG